MREENKILGWESSQVYALLDMINNNKNKTKLEIFKEFSSIYKRNLFSVRNFYYNLLDKLRLDKDMYGALSQKCNIDLSINQFSDVEAKRLVEAILRDTTSTSIRQSCIMLSKGDKKLFARYQNKFRNTIKYHPEVITEIGQELQAKHITIRKIKIDNIVRLPLKEDKITDTEIQSLFSGLVNIVKKSAYQQYESDFQDVTANLKSTLIDNRRKDILIRELREQNEKLKAKLKNLSKQSDIKASKIGELKEFFKNAILDSKKEEK